MRKASGRGVREIAALSGYNISTVSRALNNRPGVSAAVSARIVEVAREIGYRHSGNPVYAILLPESTQNIAWYTLNMLNALRQEVVKRGCRVEIVFADQNDILRERYIAGVISLDYSYRVAKKWDEVMPVVCINDYSCNTANIYSVKSNIAQGVQSAVALLVGYGHRKIGMLVNGDEFAEAAKAQLAAFETCRRLYPLDAVSQACLGFRGGKGGVPYFYGAVRELLESGVTAVINCGESESAEALAAVRMAKKRVPEDISLICWELPGLSKYQDPPLTTVQQNFSKLAEEAFRTLEALVNRQHVAADVLVDCLLHERGSVSFPAKV